MIIAETVIMLSFPICNHSVHPKNNIQLQNGYSYFYCSIPKSVM